MAQPTMFARMKKEKYRNGPTNHIELVQTSTPINLYNLPRNKRIFRQR